MRNKAFFLLCFSAFCLPLYATGRNIPALVFVKYCKLQKPADIIVKAPDPLIVKLGQLAKSLDAGANCSYHGTVSFVNLTVKANSARNVPIEFCKSANNCYYRYGDTEMLNAGGFNISILPERSVVFLGKQKVINTASVTGISGITAYLNDENYAISQVTKGRCKTIKLLNEKHISCKEYAITYDTLNDQVKNIYVRLADVHDPANRAKGNVIDLTIAAWSNKADFSKYPKWNDIISVTDRSIRLKDRYKNYKLINTLK